jgi:hypothetical protein
MATLNKKSAARIGVFVLLLWGLLLAIIGYTNGNQAAVTWHLDEHKEAILESKIDSNILNCWQARNRTDFTLVLHENQCEQVGVAGVKCYNMEQLKDLKWVRKNLRGFKKTLIVGGADFEDNLTAAAMLAHYGYETRMLAGGIELASNEPVQKESKNEVTKSSIVKPANQSAAVDEDEEVEEEEGC